MFLIVGLGNPEQKYAQNRHNIGFRVIDSLICALSATKQSDKNFQSTLYKSGQILLLKPLTFMNASGESVRNVISFYKITDFLVIHDDLDLPFGSVKFKFGGGNGGHNGLKSIDTLCGADYYRIRYGIGKPHSKEQVIHWVLSDFSSEEERENASIIEHCTKAALEIAKLDSPLQLSSQISAKYSLKAKSAIMDLAQKLPKDSK